MPNPGLRLTVELTAWWGLLFVLYLVLISTVSPLEVAVGAGASALAAVGAWAVHRAARPTLGPGGHWRAAVWAWPGALLTETVRTARLTARALRGHRTAGRMVRVRLRPGVGVAWSTALLSGTPGSCVVDVHDDGPAPVLTVHSLFPRPSGLETVLTEVERP
ncbi:Na+/H+ antiporter subunit E [Streptacidiphilus sp. P02-A3a]|uniref:Na+/H+ antiporter subunit E n=1 Tax=Streptacidiphilus sp. P02-A3a TaxID=2704468 RepID=UPI0015F82676|nr:Na+/H+ antiporter subunit E [Streptacidiphilus sp. P02-A3a]QMU69333.1 Na+/H+ antiporter subunit E [Streptacidiphilus sp. P02-A3a]